MRGLRWRHGIGVALLFALVASGCAAQRPTQASTTPPTAPATAELSALVIPRGGVDDVAAVATSKATAAKVATDAAPKFYRVTTGTDAWFAVEPGARVIAWSTQPGTDVDISFVDTSGRRREVVSELVRPLSVPDENTISGGSGQTYLMLDNAAVEGGWLVVTSRTYDNGDGDMGLQLKSAWR